jgi:hypothetical protein
MCVNKSFINILKVRVKTLSLGALSHIFLIVILEINIRGFIKIPGTPNEDIIHNTHGLGGIRRNPE